MTRSSRWKVVLGVGVVAPAAVWSLGPASAATPARSAHHAARVVCKTHPKPHGLVRLSDWQFPDTMNPAQAASLVDAWLGTATTDSLFAYDNHAKLYPQMATAVPTSKNGLISKNGKTITVHLKPNLRWSNGTRITAQDVVFSWKTAMDPNSGGWCTGSCDNIARIDTRGTTTLIFRMKDIFAPAVDDAIQAFTIIPRKWPGAWATGDVSVAAKKFFTDQNFNYENTSYITSGPYQVKQLINNDRVLLAPNKYYTTMSCGPLLNNVIFEFYSSKPGMIAAAAAHETDITENYTAADLPALLQNHTYKTIDIPGFTIEHIELNQDAQYNGAANPLSNTDVRLALALGLDKLGLIQSALGLSAASARSVEAWTFLVNTPHFKQPFADTKLIGQWDPIARKYQTVTGTGQALDDARKLLDSTPFKGGFSLDFDTTSGNPTRAAQSSVIQANWARLGVKLNINFVPASKLFARTWSADGVLEHGQFQVGMFGYTGGPDPAGYSYNLESKFCDRKASVHSPSNQNLACINDPLIDKDWEAASHTFNNAARVKYYSAVQQEMNQKAYWIPLYFKPQIITTDGRVAPFSANPTQSGSTWNIYAWRVVKTS